ncbi:MAG: sigma-70 family RNA polymerase sigma factor [Clostridia bacterium]|jgi:RNA polymerase sigma factor (sigma-70 family)|nr:sigma-70 family RNA polymerase sigma factor [Clostridia bacterium]
MKKDELEIFNKNQKLVPFTYNKYFIKHKEHKDDLMQEGFLSLINCINKFDIAKGEFSTFAVVVIKNSMSQWLRNIKSKTFRNISIDLVFDLEVNNIGLNEEYDKINFDMIINNSIKIFNKKQKSIIMDWVSGVEYGQIAQKYKCSSKYISQVINKFKTVFKYKWGQKSICENKNMQSSIIEDENGKGKDGIEMAN